MILLDNIPESLTQRYDNWKGKQDKFLKDTDIDEQYYYQDVDKTRTTFTKKQQANIAEATNIRSTINFIYPTTNHKLAILTNPEPSHKIVPNSMDPELKKVALMVDRMKHEVLRNSDAVLETGEGIKDHLVRGQGIGGVERKRKYKVGELPFEYKSYHPSEIILDANHKKRSMKYMEGYFLEREITYSMAVTEYGDLVNAINAKFERDITMEYFSKTSTGVNERLKVEYFLGTVHVREFYDKVNTTCYYIKNKKGIIQHVFKENLEEDQYSLLNTAESKESNIWVRKTLMLGDYIVLVVIDPIHDYPHDVLYHEFAGGPYKCYGLIHFAKGLQDGYDKSIQLLIMNGILQNNAGYRSPKGGIPKGDKKNWENWNDPRIIKEYTPIKIGDKVLVPEREEVQPLGNFFPYILQLFKDGIEYVTGVTALIQGNPIDAKVEVFSTLRQYQSSAMERILFNQRYINHWQMNIGTVLKDYLVADILPQQPYFYSSGQGHGTATFTKAQVNKLRLAKLGLISLPSEGFPSQKIAISTELLKIAQSTEDPRKRDFYTEKGIEMSGMRISQDIVEELSTVNQLQSTISQLEEQIERDVELLKQNENRAIRAEVQAKINAKYAQLVEGLIRKAATMGAELEIEKLEEQLKQLKSDSQESS